MNTYTASEAARLLGVSEATIRKRIKSGSLSAVKDGGAWRIPLDAIEPRRTTSNPFEPQASNTVEPPSNPAECLRRELDAALDRALSAEKRLQTALDTIEAFTEHVNRLTLLLANEQAQRLVRLPRPLSWVARLFHRDS